MAKIDFIQDLKPIFSQKLNDLGYKTQKNYSVETILYHYFNIIFRLPPVQSWTIKQSQELIDKTDSLKPSIKQGLEKFIKNAERGNNLKPWMSREINHAGYNEDLMFYDWGIYHFHLGTKTDKKGKNKGFIGRENELLFAILRPNNSINLPCQSIMYLIDIRTHDNPWSQQELIRIIENNWPNILDLYTLGGELPVNNSDEDIEGSRKNAIDPIIQPSGSRVLMSMNGGFITRKLDTGIKKFYFFWFLIIFKKAKVSYFLEILSLLILKEWGSFQVESAKVKLNVMILMNDIKQWEKYFINFINRKKWYYLEFHLKDIEDISNNINDYGYYQGLSSVTIQESRTGVQFNYGKIIK